MFQNSDGQQARAETRLAKAADRAETATRVWAEVHSRSIARDENIVRLKAARLARDAALPMVVAKVATLRKRRSSTTGGAKQDVRSKRALSKR